MIYLKKNRCRFIVLNVNQQRKLGNYTHYTIKNICEAGKPYQQFTIPHNSPYLLMPLITLQCSREANKSNDSL